MTRLASNEIFSPSKKIHREVGRAKDLPLLLYVQSGNFIREMLLCEVNLSLQGTGVKLKVARVL